MKKRVVNNGALEIYDADKNVILSISEKFENNSLDIKLAGSIVTEAAHEFEDELFACVVVCKNINIDFEKVNHISSMGLNTLLSLQKILDEEPNSELRLYNVSDSVYEEFKTVGFNDLFIIEKMNA